MGREEKTSSFLSWVLWKAQTKTKQDFYSDVKLERNLYTLDGIKNYKTEYKFIIQVCTNVPFVPYN